MSELERILEEFFEFWWEARPADATTVGIHGHDHELERWDAPALQARAEALRGYRDALDAVRPADVAAAIDRDLVVDQIRWHLYALEQARFHERDPLVYLQGPLDTLYLMAVREYAAPAERALAAADRLAALPRLLDEARANLTSPAAIFVDTAVAVARSGVALVTEVLPVYLGAALRDDLARFERWQEATRLAENALVSFARWLEQEVAPGADAEFGAGLDAFRRQLLWQHGVTDEPAALARWAGELRRETRAEMEQLSLRLTGRLDWRDAVARLEQDAAPADPVAAYSDAIDRARAFVHEQALVSFPPGETLQVTPTPEYLRPLIPYAAYLPPAAYEADQRGLFLVTPATGAAPARPAASIELTTVHEAYPGHHLQFCHANRAGSMARRVFWTSLLAEGWALYCEQLMGEQGFLRGPEQSLLQLRDLLWRACRVQADVGLHTEGWSPAAAVDFMVEQAGLDAPGAEAEVRRYCSTPTQPLSYAVGLGAIRRLRRQARERQGADFSLRGFHDELLSWGTIPPALIARGMGLD